MPARSTSFDLSRRSLLVGASAVAALATVDTVAVPWRASAAVTTDFDRFRSQWLGTLVADYDTSDPVLVTYVQDTAVAADAFWRGTTPLDTSTDRTTLWADLASPTTSSTVTSTANRLRQLALALRSAGSSLSGNGALRADLVSALDWFLAHKYDATSYHDNWWDWQIGTPLALNDFVVLMYDDLSADQISRAMAAIAHYEPDPKVTGGLTSTGANRNWACAVTMLRGAISRDQAVVDGARHDLETIFPYATAGDGMYTDGGFVQHVTYAYTAGYGLSLLQVLGTVMIAASDTPWAFSTGQVAEVFDWTQDNYAPWIYGGGLMDMNHGRGISRFYETDRRQGRLVLGVLLQLAAVFPAAPALQLRSQVKGWIAAYDSYAFDGSTPGERQPGFFEYDPVPIQQVLLTSVVLGRALMADSSVPTGQESTRTVVATSMARAVHRRPGFAMGFAMETTAIKPYECANGENRMGWYQGEGAVYLYLPNQLGQWANEWWPTADKTRIPGTTVVQQTPTVGVGVRSTVANTWAGGAVLDGDAAVGMGLSFRTQPLRARKSWFCIGDVVVCLGAGITSTDGNVIQTIVEQRNVGPAGRTAPIIDGTLFDTVRSTPTAFTPNWAYIPNTGGYLFPEDDTTVQVVREDRTGKWTDMDDRGTYEDDTTYSRRFIGFWIDHGADPTDAEYAYIQLPGATQAQVAGAAVTAADVTIVANTADVQAVTRRTAATTSAGHVTMANFWKATTPPAAAGIQVDQRASVVLRRQGDQLAVAVSDPTQRVTGDVVVTLDSAVLERDPADPGDAEVRVVATTPRLQIAVPVGGAAGRSFVARFRTA
ncbi:polysaccharide lyase 8 family protein [Curtobacterium sp. 9128]|uniref:polysaccharide lyase 8 family protein n=1 Tax=Curtobacterium sp. 9128 TaxID=1793722 RepID=UPI0011A3FDD1|nr:polysaccharide lyase 8 family protein [Curtobacterium sp. 9128]